MFGLAAPRLQHFENHSDPIHPDEVVRVPGPFDPLDAALPLQIIEEGHQPVPVLWHAVEKLFPHAVQDIATCGGRQKGGGGGRGDGVGGGGGMDTIYLSFIVEV